MCGLTGEGAGGQRVEAAAPALGIWPAHQQCLHYCLTSVAIERPLGRGVQAGDPAQGPRSCTLGPVGEVQAGLCVGTEGLGSREKLGTLALLHPFAPVPVRPLLFQGSRQQSPAPHTRVQAPTTHLPQQALAPGPPPSGSLHVCSHLSCHACGPSDFLSLSVLSALCPFLPGVPCRLSPGDLLLGTLTPSPGEGAEGSGCGGPGPTSVALRFQQHCCREAGVSPSRPSRAGRAPPSSSETPGQVRSTRRSASTSEPPRVPVL